MNSTTLPAEPPAPPSVGGPVGRELAAAREQLQRQRRRARTGIWIETLGVVALLLVAYAVPTWITDRLLRLEWAFRAALLLSFAVVVVQVFRRRLLRPLDVPLTEEEMALAVERRSPELSQSLISSLQFDDDLRGVGRASDSPELKAAVVRQVRERLQSIPFGRAIDARRVRRFFGAIALFVLFFATWGATSPSSLGTWALRNVLLTNHDWPRYTSLRFVGSDGTVRLPQGDPLAVLVAVDGPVPDRMTIEYAFRSGERGAEPMSLTGEREFTWTLDAVLASVELTVQGGDALPCSLQVDVVERPRIDDLTIRVAYPHYMERDPFDVPATEGELRLPRGALLTIAGRSQKPLSSAFLLFGSDQKIAMNVSSDWHGFQGEFEPPRSGLLSVDVIDRDRLGTGTPPKLVLRVGDDKPPTIEFRLRGIGASITAHARIPGTSRSATTSVCAASTRRGASPRTSLPKRDPPRTSVRPVRRRSRPGRQPKRPSTPSWCAVRCSTRAVRSSTCCVGTRSPARTRRTTRSGPACCSRCASARRTTSGPVSRTKASAR